MSTITQGIELFNIFSKTYGKEEAEKIVKDIEGIFDSQKQELVTKGDLQKGLSETELRLTKEIEQVRSSMIKWVAGLMIAYTGVIVAILTLWK